MMLKISVPPSLLLRKSWCCFFKTFVFSPMENLNFSGTILVTAGIKPSTAVKTKKEDFNTHLKSGPNEGGKLN